jgi:hypothetical protein
MVEKLSCKFVIFIFLSIGLIASQSQATILFEDDFDSWPTGWSAYDGGPRPPSPWGMSVLTGGALPAECNGISRPYIGGQGVEEGGNCAGGSGKCLEMPRCVDVTNGYKGGSIYQFSSRCWAA